MNGGLLGRELSASKLGDRGKPDNNSPELSEQEWLTAISLHPLFGRIRTRTWEAIVRLPCRISTQMRKGLVGVQNLDNFIEMGVDLIGQLVKLTPLLTKVRRLVGRLQQFAVLPLDVVEESPTVEASMQADWDKARLPSHESCSIGHQRERLILRSRLGFDYGDLRDDLIACLKLPVWIWVMERLLLRYTQVPVSLLRLRWCLLKDWTLGHGNGSNRVSSQSWSSLRHPATGIFEEQQHEATHPPGFFYQVDRQQSPRDHG
jgi:hypothetical protein